MRATTAAASTGAAAPAAAGSAGKPLTTRVTILTGKRMTDLALPSAVPMDSYLDDTVATLADLLEDTPGDVLAGFDFSAQGVWAFARPGFPPLKTDQTLDEAGVVDGSLLTLVAVSRTERYRPLVEDVIDAIAVLDESPEFDRDALNRFLLIAIPILTTALTVLAVLRWWDTGCQWSWPAAIGAVGLLMAAGSWVATKIYKNAALCESLLAAAYPPITVAVTLGIPAPRGAGWFGPPQLAGGAAAVMFLTLLARGGPCKRIAAATFTVVVTLAVTSAAIAAGYGWTQWLASGAILFGLFMVTSAAKLTVAFARIALPPIPAPGETIEHDELLDPVAGAVEPDDETPTWQAIIASVPSSAARLTERSNLAKQLLIGFVTAGTLILAVGAVAIVERGHFFVHTLIVAGLITLACAFRTRLYAERWCAWALLAATGVIPTGVIARLSHWYPHWAALMLAIYLAVIIIALIIVASTAAVRRVSPVTKRVLELVDGVVVAAIIPMLLWIAGIYDLVRNIKF